MKKPLCLCALLLSCSDPRARPVPPDVDLTFSPSLVVTSPGTIVGSLYAYDADGLDRVVLRVLSADSQLADTATFTPTELFELVQTVIVTIPGGIPPSTPISFVATATDFIGLVSVDSLDLVVQDTVSSAASRRITP